MNGDPKVVEYLVAQPKNELAATNQCLRKLNDVREKLADLRRIESVLARLVGD